MNNHTTLHRAGAAVAVTGLVGSRDGSGASAAQLGSCQNAIDDAAHRLVLDSLGRQDFRNPASGQTIEADAYYDHQWLSSDGSTLIQTDNSSLDPNGMVYPVAHSWTELQPR